MRVRLMGLKKCPNCGAEKWFEFEKPHGGPYYRCQNCGKDCTAFEVEICEEV